MGSGVGVRGWHEGHKEVAHLDWWFENRDRFLDDFDLLEKVPHTEDCYQIYGTALRTDMIFHSHIESSPNGFEKLTRQLHYFYIAISWVDKNPEKYGRLITKEAVKQALMWEGVMEPLEEMCWQARVEPLLQRANGA